MLNTFLKIKRNLMVAVVLITSFSGRILGPVNNETEMELVSRLERIDYILASPELSINCTNARVCNGRENYYLPDHYPVIAEFDLLNK